MNKLHPEAVSLVDAVLKGASSDKQVEKIIFPPFLYLNEISKMIAGRADFSVGAQNCSEHASGAYTGEVSAAMIASVNAKYVLAGHSERREYFGENSPLLVKKIRQALDNNLRIIYCFGEKLAERKNGSHFDVVAAQLKEVLGQFDASETGRILLAYEPVWAIGTGETATPAQAQEMHAFVRQQMAQIFNETIAATMPVLYGGSCNAQNAKELFSCPDVDGGLIGGASLKADDFCRIIDSF